MKSSGLFLIGAMFVACFVVHCGPTGPIPLKENQREVSANDASPIDSSALADRQAPLDTSGPKDDIADAGVIDVPVTKDEPALADVSREADSHQEPTSDIQDAGGDTSSEPLVPEQQPELVPEPPTKKVCRLPNGALPIVPCAKGFGMDTPAGSGRHLTPPKATIYRVTHLKASGTGSLRECMEAKGPRVCVFETSGVIELTSTIKVTHPYLTVAGESAPAPGISLHGAGVDVETSHVLLTHLRVRVGDKFPGPPTHNRDAVRISNKDKVTGHIVVDHCSLGLSSDETASVWYDAGMVTFRSTIFGQPLHASIHTDEQPLKPGACRGRDPKKNDCHGFGPLLGEFDGSVSLAHSYFVHQHSRNPLSRIEQLVMINNVIYNWGGNGTTLSQGQSGTPTRNTLIGNYYVRGPDSATSRPPIRISKLLSGSKVYLKDNWVDGKKRSTQDTYSNDGGSSQIASSAPTTTLGYQPTAASQVPANVMKNVGAWPKHRDSFDKRLIGDFQAFLQKGKGSGEIINCVASDGSTRCKKNAGGWPSVQQNKRKLTLPKRPFDDDDGDGYTNLENFLHDLRRRIEP